MVNCAICKSENGRYVELKDNFTDNSFTYFQCSNCGAISLVAIPDNYGSYYSNSYYSFNPPHGITKTIKKLRDKYELTGKGILGKMVTWVQPNPNLQSLRLLNMPKSSKLLDIGCGVGNEIRQLRELGYKHVSGIDPFIKESIFFGNDLLVEKTDVNSVNGKFDFVTMHHSFEHVFNPLDTLKAINELLLDDGTLMIRIPVMGSFAFEKYGTSWVQLDAPRHVFLHSIESMEILCSKANLQVQKVVYDSTAFQFWGSNLVKKGIDIHSAGFISVQRERLLSFLRGDNALARKMNKTGRGDQAIFIIKKQKQ